MGQYTIHHLDHEFEARLAAWASEKFPNATPHSIAAHLLREAVELYIATELQFPRDGGEVRSIAGSGREAADDILAGVYRNTYKAIDRLLSDGRDARMPDVEREAGGIGLLLCHYLMNADLARTTIGEVMRAEFERVRGASYGEPDETDGVAEIEAFAV